MTRLILSILTLMALAAPGPAPAQSVLVVVNSENPVEALSRGQVHDLFLKKTRTWSTGASVVPVDQRRGSLARDRFSAVVLGRPARDVETYWQKLVFTGRGVPPTERANDRAVLDFVRANPGAIGYVSAGAALGSHVKVLMVQ